MGNRPMKISCSLSSKGNQRAENDRDPVPQSATESSSSKVQAAPQVHCTEVFIFHITPKENAVHTLVPSEEMEGERPQENFDKSGEMASIAMTSGPSEVAFGSLEDANITPELADSSTETLEKTDVQPTGLDLLLPEVSLMPPPKTHKASSSAGHTSSCPSSKEEASIGTLSVGMAEPWKGTKDLHPSSELSNGTEVPESDQKLSGEMVLELTTDNIQEATEEHATGQRELGEATSKEALQRTAEPHPILIVAEMPNRASVIVASLANEQLAEHQTSLVSEMEGEIPEERSAVGSWKEREDLCSPKEASTENELQPNDQKVPCRMCLELTSEYTQGAAEEPTTGQRLLDDGASPEKDVDTESPLDSALVEAEGGTSSVGTAPGTVQLAEKQSIPGHDLLLAGTEMEGKVSGDSSGNENMEDITKTMSSHLEMLPVDAQDKMLAQVEAGEETACPIASNTSLEKELEHGLTTQSLSIVEERPNSHVQLLGDAEFWDAAQLDDASPTLEASLPEAHTAKQAQPPAEVTMAQSSPKALLGAAETRKEFEEASPDHALAEATVKLAGSPEAQLPPETLPVLGTPLHVSDGEEDAEFFDATDTYRAEEAPAHHRVLEAQEKHNGQDAPESPVESPELISEEAETLVHTDADSTEASKVKDSSLQHSDPKQRTGPFTPYA